MTNIVTLVREWLAASLAVSNLVDDRVSTVLDPEDGYPAIVIGPTSGGPRSDASTGVDAVEDWSVALYCYGGRVNGGDGDLPDNAVAWETAQAIASAATDITLAHYVGEEGTIVAARVVSATPTVADPDTNSSRATVTLGLQVWN